METKILKYYEDEDVSIKIEFSPLMPMLHIDVITWKPSILKKLYQIFNRITDDLNSLGYSRFGTITPNPKFAKLFGGTTVNTLLVEGKEIEVIVWG